MLSGDDCRARRKALGWTILKLAHRARISKATIKRHESGETVGADFREYIETALREGERRERADA